jgi:hypothetical protein
MGRELAELAPDQAGIWVAQATEDGEGPLPAGPVGAGGADHVLRVA